MDVVKCALGQLLAEPWGSHSWWVVQCTAGRGSTVPEWITCIEYIVPGFTVLHLSPSCVILYMNGVSTCSIDTLNTSEVFVFLESCDAMADDI